jgi:photosystem II stability/assembly factor-like uncharacterized protein
MNGSGVQALRVNRFCTHIAIRPDDHRTVFATFGGFVGAEGVKGNVWRTSDGGETWTNLGLALPDAPIHAVIVHPQTPGYVYLGTEVGVFASEDNGATWSPTNEGAANCAVYDLFWMGETLVCVTHGRGMFTIDIPSAPPMI